MGELIQFTDHVARKKLTQSFCDRTSPFMWGERIWLRPDAPNLLFMQLGRGYFTVGPTRDADDGKGGTNQLVEIRTLLGRPIEVSAKFLTRIKP